MVCVHKNGINTTIYSHFLGLRFPDLGLRNLMFNSISMQRSIWWLSTTIPDSLWSDSWATWLSATYATISQVSELNTAWQPWSSLILDELSARSSKQSVNKAELRWRSVLHTITKQTVWLKGRSTVWTYETQGERSPSFPQRMPLHNLVGVPYYSTGRSDAITLRVTIWTQTPNYAAKYQKHLEIQTPARRCSLGSKSARSSKASCVLRKKSWQQQESWTIWNQCL